MIQSRLSDKFANVVVEVVYKDGYQQADSPLQQAARSVATSGVTSEAHAQTSFPTSFAEGAGDTFKSHDQAEQTFEVVDWTTLTILPDPEQDGEAFVIANEDEVYEAMGFKEVGEIADEVAREEAAIPGISAELAEDMSEAGVHVDDNEATEPIMDWDRDNPDMAVDTIYPSMVDFRLAVRQHAIVEEFELGTEKSDKTRYRGYCKASGCPWVIRARTQDDGCIRVHLLSTNF